MGISDDIRQKKKELPKKKAPEALGPDEIKIRYSREEDEEEDTNIKHERSQIEDEFFGDNLKRFRPIQQHEVDDLDAEKDEEEKEDKNTNEIEDLGKPNKENARAKHSNPMTKWVILLVFVLIALLVWQNWSKVSRMIGLSEDDSNNKEQLQSYSSNVAGTDYTSGTTPEQTTASPAPSTSTPSTTSSTPTIDKSQITIQILNGNGITGSAGKVKTQLETAGFTVDSVTNAYRFTHPSTIVYYKTGKSVEADLVKTTLSDRQCELTNNDSVAGNYDIVVVVGKT